MSKSYYTQPRRRVGTGRGAPNKVEDEALLAFLGDRSFTVPQIADRFHISRSAAYYRLRAMETEGRIVRERGPGRFDYWAAADA